MALLRMYSLFDSAVQAFTRPIWSDHKANAIRGFIQTINDKSDPNNMVANHPDQFTLFELGVFDSNSGKFVPHETNLSCGNGLEFIKQNV